MITTFLQGVFFGAIVGAGAGIIAGAIAYVLSGRRGRLAVAFFLSTAAIPFGVVTGFIFDYGGLPMMASVLIMRAGVLGFILSTIYLIGLLYMKLWAYVFCRNC